MEKKNLNKGIYRILGLLCALINLSQLPYFVESENTQMLSYCAILLSTVFLVFKNKTYAVTFNKTARNIISMVVIVLAVQLLATTLNQQYEYLATPFTRPLSIALLVFFTGYFLGEDIDFGTFKKISFVFILTACILSMVIFSQYIVTNFNSKTYAYTSKNSVAQILFTAVVLLLFVHKPQTPFKKVVRFSVVIFITVVIIFLRSRATILGYVILPIYLLILNKSTMSKRTKFVFFLILIVALLYLSGIAEFLINQILLNGKDMNDLNAVSSGRLDDLSDFPEMISGNYLFGIGNTYFECFYLAAFLNYGIIGGTALIAFALIPLFGAIKNRRDDPMSHTFFVIALVYCINGLFECLAPIGPGAKCYFMWLMLGIMSRKNWDFGLGEKKG